MNWGDLAGKLVGMGAPILGGALGGPIGAAVGGMLGQALGVPNPTPDTVGAALDTPAAAAIVENTEAEYAKANAAIGVATVNQVNETMRAETAVLASQPDKWWGHWRTQLAYTLVAETIVWPPLIVWCVLKGMTSELLTIAPLVTTWWMARFGVLGVHVWTGSNERRSVITGTDTGVLSNLIKAIKK